MAVGYRTEDPNLLVAKGVMPNQSSNHKFGRNEDVDQTEEDIWDGGGTWVAPTQARVHAIVSTSDTDGKTGAPSAAGARTLRVWGLKTWDTTESSEDITLDGTTSVNTNNSYVIIHRMQVLTMGASGPNVGTITATAATDGSVTAQITIGQGQTLMCIYGVPSTKRIYIQKWYGSAHKKTSASVDLFFKVNEAPDVELVGGYLTKNIINADTDGTSHSVHFEATPEVYTGPAILKVAATTSADNTDVSGGFDFLIEDV